MNIISARSPYFIIINEANQTSSKVELYIYNKGTTIPTSPTYTMSEPIASVTQTETTYNISNFLIEYINQNVMANNSVPAVASNTDWCLCIVKRYATVSGTQSLLTTETFACINAYSTTDDGVNFDISDGNDFVLLSTNPYNKVYRWSASGVIPNYNFLVIRNSTYAYNVKYYNASNTLIYSNTFLTTGASEIYNFVLPLYYGASVRLDICIDTSVLYTVNTEAVEECKYTPVTCSFVNRYGGWQQLMFFKAKTLSTTIKNSQYNLMQEAWNYSPAKGQRKSFNINGSRTIKCNTGWIDESYNLIIEELLMSDRVLLDGYPVNLKTQNFTYKTHLKDKNINFEIEFEYANNILNNVI